jgi:hypothetical protein
VSLHSFQWAMIPAASENVTQLGAADLTTVQNAVNAAAAGDTIRLPQSASSMWTGSLSIAKAIKLDLYGSTITRNGTFAAALVDITTVAGGPFRMTRGNFLNSVGRNEGSNQPNYFEIGGGFSNPKFRIDNCTFGTCGGSLSSHGRISDSLGLVDHNSFTTGDGAGAGGEIIHCEGYGGSAETGWQYAVSPGSNDAVYIEDNTFTGTSPDQYFGGASAVQAYYGARWVFRHNTMNFVQVDNHGTAGNRGGRWFEIYDNHFYIASGKNQSALISLRAGSGVVFNNLLTTLGNSPGIDIYEEDTGTYPLQDQVGRGQNQTLDPLYIWSNDFGDSVSQGDIQLNRDYYRSTRSGYSAYTYPHPMQSA